MLYPRTGRAAPEGGAGANVGLRPGLRLERRRGRQREVLHGHQEHRLHVGAADLPAMFDDACSPRLFKHRSQFWFLYMYLQFTFCVFSACAGLTTGSRACPGSRPWSAATTTRDTSPSPRTRPSRTRSCSTLQQVQCSTVLYSTACFTFPRLVTHGHIIMIELTCPVL